MDKYITEKGDSQNNKNDNNNSNSNNNQLESYITMLVWFAYSL